MRKISTARLLIYSLALLGTLTPSAIAQSVPSWRTVEGHAFYEKIVVTASGLDLNHPVMAPIRNARVEVIDPTTNSVLSASQTDQAGAFEVLAPVETNCTVRVLSRLRDSNVLVLDNQHGNVLYSAASNVTPEDSSLLILAQDSNRVSGAFNILEMLQEGGEMVHLADPTLILPDLTVLWSSLNSPVPGTAKEALGATYFDPATNTISLLGDRLVDSDEFDDSVILHEYGHFVAAAFSRDSSPGGVHVLGDALDPRIAWSEGWANFFSSAARNSPFFYDSYGPSGSLVEAYDLRTDVPEGDNPGYWSEFSVHSILWDLFGSTSGGDADADSIDQPFQLLWQAFTDLKQDHQIYLPDFLEHVVDRNPLLASAVTSIAASRSIAFNPGVRPSVPNPFPRPFSIGQTVTGTLDSVSTQRVDLLQSSDFLTFQTSGGVTLLRTDITGLGPANNPEMNDLDLFLYTLDGQLISYSDAGLNGDSQLIAATLAAGTYLVEVRSYYGDYDTKKTVFNSGTYQLTVRTVTP